MKKYNYAKVKVERAELRNGKIIIVLNPDLLSNQVFSVSPFYTEGDEKNKLEYTRIHLMIFEKEGNIKIEGCGYSGQHYTTGHTQICSPNKLFLSPKEHAIHEIESTDIKYVKDSKRMGRLLGMWEGDESFLHELNLLIEKRKREHLLEEYKEASLNFKKAREEFETLLVKIEKV